MHRLVRVLLLALLSGLLLAPVATSPATAATKITTKKACNPKTFKTTWKAKSDARVVPVLTHLRTYAIGPGGTRKETRKAKFSEKVSSKVSLNAKIKVETKGFAKVIASASAEVGFGMVRRKNSTSTSAVQVTETVSNKTKNKNVQYVFYKGVSVGSGKFTKTVCGTYYASPDRTNAYYRVTRYPGTYRSYGADGSGAVRCGAKSGTLGPLAKLALNRGCKL